VAPVRADARRNRERLLAIAHEAFLEHGVRASMDDIARRAGVGPGTLYRHFPTREDLILALVARDLDTVAALAAELRDSGDELALDRWLAALVSHNVTYRGLAEAVIASLGRPTPLGAACDRLHAAGAVLVAGGQAAGTIRADLDPHGVIALAAAVASTTEHDTDDRRRTVMLRVVLDGLHAHTTAATTGDAPTD
jgi:AcrR family transcriptional regulator